MNRKLNLVIGQEVAIRNIGQYRNDIENIEEWTEPATVMKVSKKLITVKTNYDLEIKFEVEYDYNNKSKGSSMYQLYESLEAIKDEIKNHKLHSEIKDRFNEFNNYPFTTDQLERIMSILN